VQERCRHRANATAASSEALWSRQLIEGRVSSSKVVLTNGSAARIPPGLMRATLASPIAV
jgi:hypothetical protein